MENSRLVSNKITYINWLMAVLMVLYHLNPYSRFSFEHDGLYDNFSMAVSILGRVSLGYFFLMSGFLLYHKSEEPGATIRKVKSRIKTLLMPFLAWNVIGMIFRVLMDNRLPFDGITDLLLGFSFFPFDGPLWYMFCLILLLPLLPVIRRIRSKGIHIIILLCFSAISILLYAKIGNSASDALVDWGCRCIYYLPLYYLGVYCGLYHGYDIFIDKYKGASFAITGGIFMLTIILF